jgi:L-fuconolactonase
VIIDAHHHVWDPAARPHSWLAQLPTLNRRFGVADYQEACAGQGVKASVLVQVLCSTAETAEFLRLAADPASRVAGVVGWADLTSAAIATELAGLAELPGGDRLVGIRHLVQDEPDADWLTRPEVRRGLRAVSAAGLCYDLLVRPRQLPAAVRLTAELAEARFVLDHGAKPDIASGQLEPWAALIAELARRPNVSCKLSGLVTEAGTGWTAKRLAPYVDHLLACFGPERLMFGSDWPVCTLAASYAEVVRVCRELLAGRLSEHERQAVLGGSAVAAYRLTLPGS